MKLSAQPMLTLESDARFDVLRWLSGVKLFIKKILCRI
jgi:hypothetical protein